MSDSEEFYGALPAGYELHEYVIENVLGQGGFGITYLAQDKNLNKKVAIKEYLPEGFAVREGNSQIRPKNKSSQEDFRWGLERFLQEAQTLGQFQHPNIVPVLRFFEMNGTAYMVMAYQEGEGLGNILDAHGTLEESELEEILYPLLDGLRLVHEAGILHRDIKPDNIFIRADATPVLLDFGAARQAIGDRSKNITRIITPGYAPPEQYHSDGDLGPWTDIYALACVMYEAIAGAPPPEAPGRMANDKMRKAVQVGGNQFRKKFLQAIDKALAIRSEDRPQTVAEWLAMFPKPEDTELQAIRDRASRSRRLGARRTGQPGSGQLASGSRAAAAAAAKAASSEKDATRKEGGASPAPAEEGATVLRGVSPAKGKRGAKDGAPAGAQDAATRRHEDEAAPATAGRGVARWMIAAGIVLLVAGGGAAAYMAGLFDGGGSSAPITFGEGTGVEPRIEFVGVVEGEIGALTEAERRQRARAEAARREAEEAARRARQQGNIQGALMGRSAYLFLGSDSYGVTFQRRNVLRVRGTGSGQIAGDTRWRVDDGRLCLDVGSGMRCFRVERRNRGEFVGRGIRIQLQ